MLSGRSCHLARVAFSLDNSKGTETIFSHITSQRFPVDLYPYQEFSGFENLNWDPNSLQDFRLLKELPVNLNLFLLLIMISRRFL